MVWFSDFETDVKDDTAFVYLGYIEKLTENKPYWFLTIDDLIKYLHSIKENKTHTVLFHNLSFDGEYLIWYLVQNGYTPRKTTIKKSMQFKERTNFLGSRSEIYINYRGTRISFGCSYKLFPESVEKLGESLGLPKIDFDHDKFRFYEALKDVPVLELDYVQRDVRIVKETYIRYSKTYTIKKTASATAWSTFKSWYDNEFTKEEFKYRYALSKEDYDKFRPAYWGGFSFMNPKFIGIDIKQIGTYWDFNSSYPSCFVDFLMPYGTPSKDKPLGEYVEYINAVIGNIKKVDLKMPDHLHNWVRHSKKNESYIGDHDGVISVGYILEEWEELKKTYTFDIISKESIYFKADRVLGEYIKSIYHLKENEIDKVQKNAHKLILNGFYGKWGQGHLNSRKDLVRRKAGSKKFNYNGYEYETTNEESTDIKYLPVAVFTTGYGRVKMLRAIRENLDTYIYGDTDSLVILGSEIKGVELDTSKIGAMKLENNWVRFKVLKTKKYLLLTDKGETKKTLAGVPSKVHDKVDWENFEYGGIIRNGNLKKSRITGGYKFTYGDIEL